jgi:hypothetical protein
MTKGFLTGATTLKKTTHSIMAFGIITLRIRAYLLHLAKQCSAIVLSVVIVTVFLLCRVTVFVMPSVIMASVTLLNVVMLSVVAPLLSIWLEEALKKFLKSPGPML